MAVMYIKALRCENPSIYKNIMDFIRYVNPAHVIWKGGESVNSCLRLSLLITTGHDRKCEEVYKSDAGR